MSIPSSLFNSGLGLTQGSPDQNPIGGSFSDDALRLRLPNSRPLSPEKTEQARIILIQGGLSPIEADMVLEETTNIPEDSV